MIDLPRPLTPRDCDLRAYDWFPFFHKRLRQSSFWKRASDLACRISVDLWAEAYEQVPAASLPDDDHLLAEWAGFGRRDISGWLAVKDEVMSAWVRCDDGRWYHAVLSEVACAAFVKHRVHAWTRECDRLRKENARRAKSGEQPLEMPQKPLDDPFENEASAGNMAASGGSPSDNPQIPAENLLRGRARETIEEETRVRASRGRPVEKPTPKPSPLRQHSYPPDAFDRWYADYPHKVGRAAAEKAFAKVRACDSVSLETLLQAIERYRMLKPPDHAWCNPATWLNQARWEDKPATSLVSMSAPGGEDPRVDFGNGIRAPYSTIRGTWDRGRWPRDWGPQPGQPGCRIPPETMAAIMAA